MNEEQSKNLAESIVKALVELSLGKEPNIFSKSAFRKLSDHKNFSFIRDAYIDYLKEFDGKIESEEDMKRLFDFRLKILNYFNDEK